MDDKIVKLCFTCGTKLPNLPFKVGQKVRHMNGSEGEIYGVGFAVLVDFGNYKGSYDQHWLSAYPEGLAVIP